MSNFVKFQSQIDTIKPIPPIIYSDISINASRFLSHARRMKSFSSEDLQHFSKFLGRGMDIPEIVKECMDNGYIDYLKDSEMYWIMPKANENRETK